MFTLESFVMNERAEGGASQFVANARDLMGDAHFDPGLMRPYRDDRGRVWVDVTVGHEQVKGSDGFPVFNSRNEPRFRPVYDPQLVSDRRARDLPVMFLTDNSRVLRREQWAQIDATVQRASRRRLQAWADLRAANTFGGFDGWSTPVLAFERVTDAGEAIVDMDGMTEGRNFAPKFALDGMPLPITHADFFLSSRFLAVSRARGGMAADTLRAEMATRRVAERIEATLLGTLVLTHIQADLAAIGGDSGQVGKIYGYLNHPDRLTKTNMVVPDGTNGPAVLSSWLAARELMYANNFYGPFMIYTSTDYDQYLDNLFSTGEPSAGTLRSRLLQMNDIQGIRRLDYLNGTANPFTAIWVSFGDEVQAVNGMEITTVQWETMGGMRLNFKVMGIQAPRIRSVQISNDLSQPTRMNAAKAPILVTTTT
jgi:hypothetical protein